MDKKSFSRLQNQIDQRGIITAIKKIGPVYQTIVGFEVIKEYRTRRSAKRFITKIADSLSILPETYLTKQQ